MGLGGTIVDTIIKMGIQNPKDTYRFFPGIPILYKRYDEIRGHMTAAIRLVVTEFSFDSRLEDLHKKIFTKNYCPLFETVK